MYQQWCLPGCKLYCNTKIWRDTVQVVIYMYIYNGVYLAVDCIVIQGVGSIEEKYYSKSPAVRLGSLLNQVLDIIDGQASDTAELPSGLKVCTGTLPHSIRASGYMSDVTAWVQNIWVHEENVCRSPCLLLNQTTAVRRLPFALGHYLTRHQPYLISM